MKNAAVWIDLAAADAAVVAAAAASAACACEADFWCSHSWFGFCDKAP